MKKLSNEIFPTDILKHSLVLFTNCCTLGFFILSIFISSSVVFAATISVPGDFATIQAAIDASQDGDTVIVADGTYVEKINFPVPTQNKNITLISENGPEFTIIDGGNSGTVVLFPASSDSILEGFTITNGRGSEGGGILIARDASPFITNCIITNNRASFGGGILCGDSSAPIITNCTFQNNSATGDRSDDNGGGLHGSQNSTPIIINCDFKDNTSEHNGGAMAFNTAEPLIVNCTFDNNTAALSGGAISLLESAPKITNCSFSNNSALTNPSGAISCNNPTPETTVTNSIFWGDHPAEIACDANTISVTYSDIQGGPAWPQNSDMMGADRWPGTGNINADPRFLDQANGDFHLTNDSPCIDAGDNSDPDLQPTDIAGDDRKIDDPAVADTGNGDPPIVDMGAFEKYLDVESPPPIEGGNEWTQQQPGGGNLGGGGISYPADCVDGEGDCYPGGIFGDILKSSVIGYHLDGWTAEGIEIYMPVTQGFKALKGAQEYVRSFAPALAEFVRECFDYLEQKADANKEGFLYKSGNKLFPILGKIAEFVLDLLGEEKFIETSYSNTTISIEKFKELEGKGLAFAPKVLKDIVHSNQEIYLMAMVY